MPLDVHLMIEEPDRFIEAFVEAGAAMISVHVEVLPHLHRTIQFIKSLGAKAGVAINPSTPVVALEEIAADVDHVLVMSVNPGFGGQTFIPRSESKITAIRALLDRPRQRRAHRGGRRHRHDQRGADRRGRRQHPRRRQLDLRHRRTRRRRRANCAQAATGGDGAPGMTAAPSVSRVRVRYAETDKMGVVYYANYFVWFEVARTDLLRALGWSYREMEERRRVAAGHRGALPVSPPGAVRRRAGREDGGTACCRRCEWSSPTRSCGAADQAVAASGRTVHAALDRTGKPCRLPERIRQVFA